MIQVDFTTKAHEPFQVRIFEIESFFLIKQKFDFKVIFKISVFVFKLKIRACSLLLTMNKSKT